MKLLIIEDDINLANTLARRFVKQGFECELAHSSKQALEKLAIFEASHFLVDLKIGDDNGLTLIKPIRTQLPTARIVLLTGFASIASAVEAIRLGADDYLPKPVDFNSLIKIILGDARKTIKKLRASHHVWRSHFLLFEQLRQPDQVHYAQLPTQFLNAF